MQKVDCSITGKQIRMAPPEAKLKLSRVKQPLYSNGSPQSQSGLVRVALRQLCKSIFFFSLGTLRNAIYRYAS